MSLYRWLALIDVQIISITLAILYKGKEDHTPKERRRGAHLPFIGRWARKPLLSVTHGHCDGRPTVTYAA